MEPSQVAQAERRTVVLPYTPRLWARKFHASLMRWAVLILHRRAGKAQPLSAQVLTPRGFVTMGSLVEGDVVLTPVGRRARVVGVFPQGDQPTFRVTLADGSSTVATADHLWKVGFANRRRRDKAVTTEYLRQFLERERGRTRKNKSRPLLDSFATDVEFGVGDEFPIEPYALGLLLGDGGYVKGALEALRGLGLMGKRAEGKFIPGEYMRAPRWARLAVMQGLLDTGGYAGGGGFIEYCSVSGLMAKQVETLARGLGWVARMSDGGLPTFTYKGETKLGQRRFRVFIRAPKGAAPFRRKHKAARFTGYRWEQSRKAIVSIEPTGRVEPCQCIKIDDPDQLYVTDDFVVTHNTTAVVNHHSRFAMDDEWEKKRLLFLRPELTPADLETLVHPPGGRHYGHVLPTYKQAKLVVWDALKYYVKPVEGVAFNESELLVRFANGSKLQLFGADNPDSLRGPAFSGISFDEYSQQPPQIFSEVISKALADHLGYAIFCGTIKGKDHLYKMHEAVKDDPEWFALWQDITTSIATETGITVQLLNQAMEDDRKLIAKNLMTQAEFDQEWFLSPEAAVKGAFYANEMKAAREQGRICRVPYDPVLPVDTDWDLGVGDSTSIIFSQSLKSGEVRIIDYYENSGEGLPHYAKVLNDKGYTYGQHWAPHDIKVRELGSGKSRIETAKTLGINFRICPNIGFDDGVHAVRMLLPRCWFDGEKCSALLDALTRYRKDWNQRLNEFKDVAVHDVFSHAADATRYLAVRHKAPRDAQEAQKPPQQGPHYPINPALSWMS